MAKGSGVRCGASYINASKVCRVSMPPEIQKALNAATGEIGAKSLRAAVQKHAGNKGLARLREIRVEVRNEMGGNIVKGPKADEVKRRLQAEGILPKGKAKSDASLEPLKLNWANNPKAPSVPQDLRVQLAALDGPTNRDLKKERDKLSKEQNALQKELDALVKERDKTKPDFLYEKWDTKDMKQFRDGMINRNPEKYKDAIKRINKELARRDELTGPAKEVKGSDMPHNLTMAKEMLSDIRKKGVSAAIGGRESSFNRALEGQKVAEKEVKLEQLRKDREDIRNDKGPEARAKREQIEADILALKADIKKDKYNVDAPGGVSVGAKDKSQIAQLQSALGLGAQTRQEVGRDLEGLVDEAVAKRNRLQFDIKGKGGEERRAMQQEIDVLQKAIDGPKTGASAGTRYARESAKNFDKQILREDLRREGDKNFDGWDATIGKGSKKLGQGAYGTVIRTEDKSYAVKRGDLSDTEATLIKKLGEADLGPKLIAADIDGPGRMSNPGVDVRNGRLAMSIVAGSPIGSKAPDKVVGGVKVADAYWTARANLHRMGIAHNDMHIDNVLVDRKGKGRFVDMGLAQESPKAALAEALGAFDPPKGGIANRVMEAGGQGDWQVRRWNGTAGRLLAAAQESEHGRRVLENRAPVAARVLSNKNAVQSRMQKDGFSKDDIASVMDHGLRSPLSTYNQGVWSRMTDDQAMRYINMLYEGV